MRLVCSPHGWEDCTHWQATDRAMVTRINRLIDDVLRDPFSGIGKPEQLRHALAVPGLDGSERNTGSSTWSTVRTW